MALVSLEQQRQRERADERANKIRQELAEYDLAHSKCPVDRRIAEKQAEARAQEAREAKEQQQTANWASWIDALIAQRIAEFQRRYFMSGDEKHPGALTQAIGQVMGENRK